MVTEAELAAKFSVVLPHLDERQRRLVLGAEARMLGRGGGRVVARAARVREATVSRGVSELESGAPPLGRVRQPGGGRKRVDDLDPGLVPALLALVEPDERGDPESPLRWTTRSTRNLAAVLCDQGHQVCADVVAGLLREQGFSLQANAKTLEGKQNPDRDAQFRYINDQVKAHQVAGEPVVSVDTKKKELIGQFANAGGEWRPKGDPVQVNTHDFPSSAVGKAIPYGIYDPTANTGWVNVGTDHDTATFAVASLRRWWVSVGATAYPEATHLLITADAGGSNSYRTRAWKTELAALAAEIGLQITVCHFPPGTSKWNAIEHRLFSHISTNWRGRPLTSHDVVINTIAATRTRTGLSVGAQLDAGTYPTGVTVSDAQLAAIPITRHDWHGEWNYTINPEPLTPTAESGTSDNTATATGRQRDDLLWLHAPELTGLPPGQLAQLVTALTPKDQAGRRAQANGRHPATSLADRVAITLQKQRFSTPLTVLAELIGISPAAIAKAIKRTRALLDDTGHLPEPTATTLTTATEIHEFISSANEFTSEGTVDLRVFPA
ncbi:ISAzo13 family transposase [Nocardia sp. NBC_00565]|nr:ISAzo13 family transposase [Nocardia sp. NBC_00565]WUC07777.1 ISAzo13 family transposase [Nocardia sp. NBC_00565]